MRAKEVQSINFNDLQFKQNLVFGKQEETAVVLIDDIHDIHNMKSYVYKMGYNRKLIEDNTVASVEQVANDTVCIRYRNKENIYSMVSIEYRPEDTYTNMIIKCKTKEDFTAPTRFDNPCELDGHDKIYIKKGSICKVKRTMQFAEPKVVELDSSTKLSMSIVFVNTYNLPIVYVYDNSGKKVKKDDFIINHDTMIQNGRISFFAMGLTSSDPYYQQYKDDVAAHIYGQVTTNSEIVFEDPINNVPLTYKQDVFSDKMSRMYKRFAKKNESLKEIVSQFNMERPDNVITVQVFYKDKRKEKSTFETMEEVTIPCGDQLEGYSAGTFGADKVFKSSIKKYLNEHLHLYADRAVSYFSIKNKLVCISISKLNETFDRVHELSFSFSGYRDVLYNDNNICKVIEYNERKIEDNTLHAYGTSLVIDKDDRLVGFIYQPDKYIVFPQAILGLKFEPMIKIPADWDNL